MPLLGQNGHDAGMKPLVTIAEWDITSTCGRSLWPDMPLNLSVFYFAVLPAAT